MYLGPSEDYYEPCCDYDDGCQACQDAIYNKMEMISYVKKIIDQVYGKTRFDAQVFEDSLEEMSHYFGIKLLPGVLKIAPVKQKNDLLEFAADLSRAQARIAREAC